MFLIIFYETNSGKVPVREFLDGLEPGLRSKALRSLEILKEYGNRLREPDSKYLGDGIFELRFRFSNDIARVFYFFVAKGRIVVIDGFIKKTNKTPRKEWEKARKAKGDWEARHNG